MLTILQIACIIAVLNAFGVDPSVLANVEKDLAPAPIIQVVEATSTPTVQTPTPASNTPVQPVFGATETTCDDTPTISVQVYGSSAIGSGFDTQLADPVSISTNEDIGFYVQAQSVCGSSWLIDEHGVPFQIDSKNQSSKTYNRLSSSPNFGFKASQPETYPVVFTAHDGKTVGTTTETIVVQ